MKRMEKCNVRSILKGLLAGFAAGIVIEGLAALAGGVRGGAAGALRWAQLAGFVIGAAGAWLLLRQIGRKDAPVIYRPGRTAIEAEYEIRDENRRYEQSLRESGGEEHRMPRRGIDNAVVWVDIGVLLAALVPVCISLPD